MEKYLGVIMISLILSGLYGLEADRNYTEMEFHRSLGIEAVYSTSDVLRLMSYDKDHRGNFYDYALQGSFLHAAHRQKTKLPRKLSQCRTIQELYESKTSKQEFRETLAGVRKLLSEKHNESSPCVIAFCLLSEIMPHKKELNSSDIAFFLDIYRKTDSKIIQHALYTAILNGDNAIKHREIILESGTWLDVYYLYLSLIATMDGEEREAWKKQLQMLKTKSPVLEQWIDSSLEDFRKSERR